MARNPFLRLSFKCGSAFTKRASRGVDPSTSSSPSLRLLPARFAEFGKFIPRFRDSIELACGLRCPVVHGGHFRPGTMGIPARLRDTTGVAQCQVFTSSVAQGLEGTPDASGEPRVSPNMV